MYCLAWWKSNVVHLMFFVCQMQVVGKKGESHWRGKDDTTYCCNLSTGVSLRQHDWAKSTHTHTHGAPDTSLSSPSEGERAREDTALSQWGRVSPIIFIWKPPENVPVNKVDPFSKACGYCLSVLTFRAETLAFTSFYMTLNAFIVSLVVKIMCCCSCSGRWVAADAM